MRRILVLLIVGLILAGCGGGRMVNEPQRDVHNVEQGDERPPGPPEGW